MRRVLALVGPTAVGKTEVSLDVAERLEAEIVSLDSMQLYRGMDIGTAKATPAMRARVPHHLLDVFEATRDVSVAEFQRLARHAIRTIAARGRVPLLVGGSGLYLRAVVDDLRFPPTSPDVRARLEEEAEQQGPEELHRRLTELDPRAASKMEPSNARRVVRALEVIELTGRPFSDNATWDDHTSIYDLKIAGLERPRDELYERIEERARMHLAAGLLTEAQRLAAAGMSRTARQALGYRQVLDAPPTATIADVAAEIARATKRFARRQESWFRADPRIGWFDARRPDLVEALVAYLDAGAGALSRDT